MRRNFTDEEWNSLKTFYCPGGFNYEKMSGFSRFMMKMFTTMLANKKDAVSGVTVSSGIIKNAVNKALR